MKASKLFSPVKLSGQNMRSDDFTAEHCGEHVARHKDRFLHGSDTFWGIPFHVENEGNNMLYLSEGKAELSLDFPKNSDSPPKYLIFLHSAQTSHQKAGDDGITRNYKGIPPIAEDICEYIVHYADGSDAVIPIRSRIEINDMNTWWGQGGFLCVPYKRGTAFPTVTDEIYAGKQPHTSWGESQCRAGAAGWGMPFNQWLFAWENPKPKTDITGITAVHKSGKLFLSAVTAGYLEENPLRYGRRKKIAVRTDKKASGLLELADIDLGHIISVLPKPFYNNAEWEKGYNNKQPEVRENEYIVEFDAHEDAYIYIGDNAPAAVGELYAAQSEIAIKEAELPVRLTVMDAQGIPVPVKVHAHGAGGEYLPPRNRHRIPNPYWFEDYSVDFTHGQHWCTYINGKAEYLLPVGEVYFEISKGFEISPVRKKFTITPETGEITVKLDNILDWRKKGWVTADTHVHFLSPQSALLEGEAEGVNVVNLLASQWGELFTNIGDFDGKNTVKSGDEYLVRVGTENRQHILGHISLLGYEGAMILPLTTGGPDESAFGDPVETTLTEWARQSRAQNGVNILPHFPNPKAEGAAAIVSEVIDGVEMTSWGDLYSGISPYSLSDWYRYLNCGYHVAAVGGTDKMSADTAVGTVRTYAKIDGVFSYDAWKNAVRSGRTFATYGALAEIRVEGREMGEKIKLSSKQADAILNVEWSAGSVTIPITSVELVVNGESYDGIKLDSFIGSKSGCFTVKADRSMWIALRVRGHHSDKPEIITAHTSAVMVEVDGQPPMNAADAMTILEQIEGVSAYVKTLGTRAKDHQFKKVLMTLTAAHRSLHNRMHEQNHYHHHSAADAHNEGHK